MNTQIVVNGVEVTLGVETLTDVISQLPDTQEFESVFEELSKSPSYTVRAAVAVKTHLSPEVVNRLAHDKTRQVVSNLLANSSVAKQIPQSVLAAKLAQDDPELLVEIIGELHGLPQLDHEAVAVELASHPDPAVRRALAQSCAVTEGWR